MVTFKLEAEAYDLVRAATNLPNTVMGALLEAQIAGDTGRVVICDPIEADKIRQWFDTARAITADPEKVRACGNAVDAIDEALHGQGS